MAIATMRNRVTTEFRKVEPGSDEYLELQSMRDPNDGYPVWEETSLPDAVESSKRLESGNPLPTDIGDGQQPVGRITGAHDTYMPASMVREPLASEREAGVEQEDTGPAGMPMFEDHIAEVPLTAAMESPTDTDVGGTEPDLGRGTRRESGASGSQMKERKSSKKSEKSGEPSGEKTQE